MLHFSSPVGPLVGRWRQADLLELRMAPGAAALEVNPFSQELTAITRPGGGIAVEQCATDRIELGT